MPKNIRKPILFQGDINRNEYFEGWYYKQVSSVSEKVISFIPGISLNKYDSHAFIQVIESQPLKTYYFKYDMNTFKYNNDPFSIKIGDSTFSKSGISVNICDVSNKINGEIYFSKFQQIETNLFMPNIMGPFAYLPTLDCNHGVISMNHFVNGNIKINGECIKFSNDKGYIEKDWGKTFPNKYIWIQGNNFNNSKDSFVLSIANVPFFHKAFLGHIANLHMDDIEYRFATYNGSRIVKAISDGNNANITIKRSNLIINIKAKSYQKGNLKAPINGEMRDVIKEGLGGDISLELYKDKRFFKKMETDYAGIEIVKEWNINKN